MRDAHRANDLPILNPSYDAGEEPFTLTLSPRGRGKGFKCRDAQLKMLNLLKVLKMLNGLDSDKTLQK